jgi:hypothetical protein
MEQKEQKKTSKIKDKSEGLPPMEKRPIGVRVGSMLLKIPSVQRDQTANTNKFSYDYVSLDSIITMLKPLLGEHLLYLVQPITISEDGTQEILETRIVDAVTSQTVLSSKMILSKGLTSQEKGSEITYFRRYSLASMLSLAVDEDDDGAAANKAGLKKRSKSKATQPPSQNMTSDSLFIELNYQDINGRTEAKKAGAKWDATAKKWALPDTPENRAIALAVSTQARVFDKNGQLIEVPVELDPKPF